MHGVFIFFSNHFVNILHTIHLQPSLLQVTSLKQQTFNSPELLHHNLSVSVVSCHRRRLLTFPLIDFFSRTTGPNSTKLGRNHAWGMGIQLCSNKGAGHFCGPIRGKIRKILINIQKHSHEPLAGMH